MPRIAAAEKTVSRRSLTDLAYDHLRSAILHGELPVGTILAEATIAEQLGISKTPVRQALQLVEHARIADALEQRDTAAALEALHTHLHHWDYLLVPSDDGSAPEAGA